MATRYRQCKTFSPQAFRPSKCKHCFKETNDHDSKCKKNAVTMRRTAGAKKAHPGLLKRGSSVELLKLKFEAAESRDTSTSGKSEVEQGAAMESTTDEVEETIEVTEKVVQAEAECTEVAQAEEEKDEVVRVTATIDTVKEKDHIDVEAATKVYNDNESLLEEAPEVPSSPLPDESTHSVSVSFQEDESNESAVDVPSISAFLNVSPIPRAKCLADISNADISAGSITTVKSPVIKRKSTAKRKSSRMESESVIITRQQLAPMKKVRQDTWV